MSDKRIRLMIIDDEPAVRSFLRLGLESHGYLIEEAGTGQDGITKTVSQRPELIILDLGLPDMDGLTVLKTLRGWTKVPVVVLTVRDSDQDKVALLEAGADDYLTKPFSMLELMARLKVAVRHGLQNEEALPVFRSGRLEIDFVARIVRLAGQSIRLTATEYNVLRILALAHGRIVTQQYLLNEVWGPNTSEAQYLRVYIGTLRKKLEVDPTTPILITTDPGVGYRLNLLP